MIRTPKLVGTGLIILGGSLLLISVLPIASSVLRFYLFAPPKLIDPTAVSPFPAPYVINIFGVATVDYTNPESWFSTSQLASPSASGPAGYYNLTLPRLKLSDIPVQINGLDLKKNAIHYPGTALPGSYGNTVIFGHSALSIFYREDSPLTIFNPLPKTKVGDPVVINYDGITYRYLVSQIKEVSPDQISVLAQHYDRHQLTLITCVPLGTYWHRFIVIADLVN